MYTAKGKKSIYAVLLFFYFWSFKFAINQNLNVKPTDVTTERHPERVFFFRKTQTFGLGQTNWAEHFWRIWDIFGQFISTHLGTVGSLICKNKLLEFCIPPLKSSQPVLLF